MSRPPLVLSIDVEPDGFFYPPGGGLRWTGFETAYARMTAFRRAWQEASGRPARFGWYLRADPEVEAAAGRADDVLVRYPREFEALAEAGDTLGSHVHCTRFDSARGGSVLDYGDPAWVDECVERTLAAVSGRLGEPVRVTRMGDGYASGRVCDRLRELGVAAELSIEPGLPARRFPPDSQPQTGFRPDTVEAPRGPYKILPGSFDRADPSTGPGLMALPLGIADFLVSARRVVDDRPPELVRGGDLPPGEVPGDRRRDVFHLNQSPFVFGVLREFLLGKHGIAQAAVRADCFVEAQWVGPIEKNLVALAALASSGEFDCAAPEAALAAWATRGGS